MDREYPNRGEPAKAEEGDFRELRDDEVKQEAEASPPGESPPEDLDDASNDELEDQHNHNNATSSMITPNFPTRHDSPASVQSSIRYDVAHVFSLLANGQHVSPADILGLSNGNPGNDESSVPPTMNGVRQIDSYDHTRCGPSTNTASHSIIGINNAPNDPTVQAHIHSDRYNGPINPRVLANGGPVQPPWLSQHESMLDPATRFLIARNHVYDNASAPPMAPTNHTRGALQGSQPANRHHHTGSNSRHGNLNGGAVGPRPQTMHQTAAMNTWYAGTPGYVAGLPSSTAPFPPLDNAPRSSYNRSNLVYLMRLRQREEEWQERALRRRVPRFPAVTCEQTSDDEVEQDSEQTASGSATNGPHQSGPAPPAA